MRTIHIPAKVLKAAHIGSSFRGSTIQYAVHVNWPELRLTEEQQFANAVALAFGQDPPYEDHSLIAIELDRFE